MFGEIAVKHIATAENQSPAMSWISANSLPFHLISVFYDQFAIGQIQLRIER